MQIIQKDITKCKGRIEISWICIHENPDEVQKVFAKVIPVRAELKFISNSIEYDCLSYEFEQIEDYEEPPKYKATVENGVVSFKRII